MLKLSGRLEGLSLTPDMVLRGRTPAGIARLLKDAGESGYGKRAKNREEYRLTDSQMGVYLECVNDPEATMYNIPMCCELPKKIDLNRLKGRSRAIRRSACGSR